MDKNFPAYIFDQDTNSDNDDSSYKSFYSPSTTRISDKISQTLSFKHLINLEFNDDNSTDESNNIKCLTQNFYFGDCILPTTRLLPCSLPEKNDILKDNHFDDPVWKFDVDSLDEIDYYYAICNESKDAKFFPTFFSRGTRGKSILTNDKQWLTPVEYALINGIWHNDWKGQIRLSKCKVKKNEKFKRKKNKVKDLIENKELESVHSYNCECENCFDYFYLKNKNLSLIKTLFLNQNDLIMIHPSKRRLNQLDINKISLPNSFDLSTNGSFISETILKNNNLINTNEIKFQDKINQIFTTKFTEFDYFNNISKPLEEVFLNISYGISNLKTIKIVKQNDNELLNIQDVYDIDFGDEKIIDLNGSDMIKGECAVVTNKNNVYLLSDFLDDKKYMRVCHDIEPYFKSDINCKHISFGNNPREFIYTDYSQIVSIDSRVKSNKKNMKDILKLPCKYLNRNEIIYRHQKLDSNFNCHLACCSNSLVVIDQRFPNYPLLKWDHGLKSPINLLESFSLKLEDSYETSMCIFSDSKYVYCNQFSLNLNKIPIAQNYPLKLNSATDFYSDICESTHNNKTLNRYLNYKSRKPILSLSHLKDKNSFALFQYQDGHNLFYQCFNLPKNCVQKKFNDETELLKIWSDQLEEKVIENLETSFDDMHLEETENNSNNLKIHTSVESHRYCKICNYKSFNKLGNISIEQFNDRDYCEKCGNFVKFTHKLFDDSKSYDNNVSSNKNMKFIKNVNLNFDENEISNFTKELISIWSEKELIQDNSVETSSKYEYFQEPLSKRQKNYF